MTATRDARLTEIALLFLKLGVIGFGGPAAHIAMMEDEVVRRRRWLTREQFLDYVGATNLIPGPNSTELAIHIGRERAGWPGLLVAGSCFILPAALIVGAIAWAYVRFGAMPQAGALLRGITPVVIAIVLQALWGLGHTAMKSRVHAALAIVTVVAAAFGLHELLILIGAGAAMLLVLEFRTGRPDSAGDGPSPPSAVYAPGVLLQAGAAAGGVAVASAPFGLLKLFGLFLKIGATLFGSGYVLLAFLRSDFVVRLGWLTEGQLLDAIAVGQITPGPVFTTATFVGYVVGGAAGALVATVGIFLPAFFFVAVSGPLLPRLRRSPRAGAVLDGVNVASLALMAVVTVQLGRHALIDAPSIAVAMLSALLLFRFRVNSAWLVLGGGLVGLLRSQL